MTTHFYVCLTTDVVWLMFSGAKLAYTWLVKYMVDYTFTYIDRLECGPYKWDRRRLETHKNLYEKHFLMIILNEKLLSFTKQLNKRLNIF